MCLWSRRSGVFRIERTFAHNQQHDSRPWSLNREQFHFNIWPRSIIGTDVDDDYSCQCLRNRFLIHLKHGFVATTELDISWSVAHEVDTVDRALIIAMHTSSLGWNCNTSPIDMVAPVQSCFGTVASRKSNYEANQTCPSEFDALRYRVKQVLIKGNW